MDMETLGTLLSFLKWGGIFVCLAAITLGLTVLNRQASQQTKGDKQ